MLLFAQLIGAFDDPSQSTYYARETLRHSIESNMVVIFSQSQCPRSEKTKAFFEDMGVPYYSLELDTRSDEVGLKRALSDLTGTKSVPRVFVNGQHVGGSVETERAYKTGELEHWINSERLPVKMQST